MLPLLLPLLLLLLTCPNLEDSGDHGLWKKSLRCRNHFEAGDQPLEGPEQGPANSHQAESLAMPELLPSMASHDTEAVMPWAVILGGCQREPPCGPEVRRTAGEEEMTNRKLPRVEFFFLKYRGLLRTVSFNPYIYGNELSRV